MSSFQSQIMRIVSLTVGCSSCWPAFSKDTRVMAICFWRGVRNLTFSGTRCVSYWMVLESMVQRSHSMRKNGAIKPATIVTMPSMMKI